MALSSSTSSWASPPQQGAAGPQSSRPERPDNNAVCVIWDIWDNHIFLRSFIFYLTLLIFETITSSNRFFSFTTLKFAIHLLDPWPSSEIKLIIDEKNASWTSCFVLKLQLDKSPTMTSTTRLE